MRRDANKMGGLVMFVVGLCIMLAGSFWVDTRIGVIVSGAVLTVFGAATANR